VDQSTKEILVLAAIVRLREGRGEGGRDQEGKKTIERRTMENSAQERGHDDLMRVLTALG
jgi:hypothetical protein